MDQKPRQRKVTPREFFVSAVLSSLAGVLFTWWFAVGRIPASTSRLLVFGAVAGFFIGLPFMFVEQFFGRWLDGIRARLRAPARAFLYFVLR